MAFSSPAPAKPAPNTFGMLAMFGVGIIILGVLSPRLMVNGASAASDSDSSSLVWLLFRILLFVLLAGTVCIALIRITRNRPNAIGNLKVLASLPVEQIMIHLVQAGDKRLLIGIDASGVKSLAELPGRLTFTAPATTSTAVPIPASAAVKNDSASQVLGPLPASVPAAFATELASLLVQRGRG